MEEKEIGMNPSPFISMGANLINPLMMRNGDESYGYMKNPITGALDFKKSEVNVDNSEFDVSNPYAAYKSEENPYDTGVGADTKRFGAITTKRIGQLAPLGAINPLIPLIGGAALGFAETGIFGKAAKEKQKEFEEMERREKQEFFSERNDYLQNERMEAENMAKRTELARRGIPNYTSSIYNI